MSYSAENVHNDQTVESGGFHRTPDPYMVIEATLANARLLAAMTGCDMSEALAYLLGVPTGEDETVSTRQRLVPYDVKITDADILRGVHEMPIDHSYLGDGVEAPDLCAEVELGAYTVAVSDAEVSIVAIHEQEGVKTPFLRIETTDIGWMTEETKEPLTVAMRLSALQAWHLGEFLTNWAKNQCEVTSNVDSD